MDAENEKLNSYSIGISTGFLTKDLSKKLINIFYKRAPEVFEYEIVNELVKIRNGRKATRADIENYLSPKNGSIVVYARDKNTREIVGVAAIVKSRGTYKSLTGDGKNYEEKEIYVWVAEGHRGKGLGTELTKRAIKAAKMRGYKEIIANLNNGKYRKVVEKMIYKVSWKEGYRRELLGYDVTDNGPVYKLYIADA